jgi:Ca2+-binding EF-hand superfamily protein
MKLMSDRVMTRDEAVQHVRKLFARLDANKDGFLTREEVDSFHDKMMGMHGDIEKRLGEHGVMMSDRGAMFDRLDANHDGNISRQEFMAAQPRPQERRVMIFRNGPDGGPGAPGAPGEPGMKMRMHGMGGFGGHLFEMADSNRDGRVSLQEAEAAALAHFDKADLNHDGKITPEERQQAHQFRHGERRPS